MRPHLLAQLARNVPQPHVLRRGPARPLHCRVERLLWRPLLRFERPNQLVRKQIGAVGHGHERRCDPAAHIVAENLHAVVARAESVGLGKSTGVLDACHRRQTLVSQPHPPPPSHPPAPAAAGRTPNAPAACCRCTAAHRSCSPSTGPAGAHVCSATRCFSSPRVDPAWAASSTAAAGSRCTPGSRTWRSSRRAASPAASCAAGKRSSIAIAIAGSMAHAVWTTLAQPPGGGEPRDPAMPGMLAAAAAAPAAGGPPDDDDDVASRGAVHTVSRSASRASSSLSSAACSRRGCACACAVAGRPTVPKWTSRMSRDAAGGGCSAPATGPAPTGASTSVMVSGFSPGHWVMLDKSDKKSLTAATWAGAGWVSGGGRAKCGWV
eukprot:355969-Chlamydomonas_euryale.AAC.1